MEMNHNEFAAVNGVSCDVLDARGRLLITPNPVTTDGQRNVPADLLPGESLEAFLRRHVPGIESGAWTVMIGGATVPRAMWSRTRPKHGQLIACRASVGKQVLAIVAVAVLAYFTMGASLALTAGGTFLGMSGAVGYAALMGAQIAGSLLINKVLGPKAAKAGDAAAARQVYSLSGQRNSARAYESLPVLWGEMRVTPDLASQPYTWFEGEDQYLSTILLGGVNVHSAADLAIGDTPISGYSDVSVFYNGFSGMASQDVPLYGNADSIAGGELENNGAWVTRTSSAGSIALQVDLEGQLYDIDGKGGPGGNSVPLFIETRPVGGEAWQTAHSITLANATLDVVRRTFTMSVALGRHEVRVRLGQPHFNDGDGKDACKFTWNVLKSIQPDATNYNAFGRIGIKIKASGQLAGGLDTLRATYRARPLPVWSGTTWVTATTREEGLSNPGAILLQTLRGVYTDGVLQFGFGMQDAQIDIEGLKAFMLHCAARGYRYDRWVTGQVSLGAFCQEVALAGMGEFTWTDGSRPTAVFVSSGQPLSGVVNMANMLKGSFSVAYNLANAADGIEYQYLDRDRNWETQTLRVAAPGVTTMLNPARITGEGVTSEAHAAVLARYHLAQSLYQYKTIDFGADIEHLAYRRLSVLSVSHDLTQWGFGGRVMHAERVGGKVVLQLDEPVPPLAQAYVGLRVPGARDYRVFQVEAIAAETDRITLVGAWPADVAFPGEGLDNPAHDTLWCYDFKATPGYRVRVVGMQPEADLKGAQVSCVPEGPEFWNYVLNGVYTPTPNQSSLPQLGRPTVTNLRVTEKVNVQGDTEWYSLALVWDVEGDYDHAQVWAGRDGSELRMVDGNALASRSEFRIDGAGQWLIEVRPFNASGLAGQSATVLYITTATQLPPRNVDEFLVQSVEGGLRRYSWWYTGDRPPAFAGVQIRYLPGDVPLSVADWDDMQPLGEADDIYSAQLETTRPDAGLWTFGCRVIDTAGQLANGMARFVASLGDSFEQVQQPDLTPPPDVTGLTVTAMFTAVLAEWDVAHYKQGHGHARTIIYAAEGAGSTFAQAKPMAEAFAGPVSFASEPATTWNVWAKHESVDGILSVNAAGPLLAKVGESVEKVLESMNGKINEDQLVKHLGDRIGLVDGIGPGSVTARLLAEAQARAQALAVEARARMEDLAAEAKARAAAVASEAQARGQELSAEAQERAAAVQAEAAARQAALAQVAADLQAASSALQSNIDAVNAQVADIIGAGDYDAGKAYDPGQLVKHLGKLYRSKFAVPADNAPPAAAYWVLVGDYASIGEAVAAHAAQLADHTVRIEQTEQGLTAEATSRNALAVQLRGNYSGADLSQVTSGLVWSERQARVTGDGANATAIQAVSARMPSGAGAVAAAADVVSEQQARVAGDGANASLTQGVRADLTSTQGIVAGQGTAISGLQSSVTSINGALTSQAGSITSLQSAMDARTLGVPVEQWKTLATHSIATITDGKVGPKALRLGTGAPSAWATPGFMTPLDHSKTYRTRFWARPSADCNGLLYFALRQFLANSSPGPANSGLAPYKPSAVSRAAHNAAHGADAWGEYSFLWTAADWQANVTQVTPTFLQNYGGTAGYWEIQGFEFTDVTGEQLNAAATSALTTRLTAAEGVNATQTTNITNLTNSVVGKADSSALTSLGSRVTTVEGTITSQGDSLTSLTNKLNHAATGLDAKASSAALSALDSKVTTQGNSITSQGGAITKLENDIATVAGDVANKASAAALTDLTTRVTATEGVNSTQSGSLTSLRNDLTALSGTVDSKASSAALATLQSTVTGQGTTLTAQGTNIVSLSQSLENIAATSSNSVVHIGTTEPMAGRRNLHNNPSFEETGKSSMIYQYNGGIATIVQVPNAAAGNSVLQIERTTAPAANLFAMVYPVPTPASSYVSARIKVRMKPGMASRTCTIGLAPYTAGGSGTAWGKAGVGNEVKTLTDQWQEFVFSGYQQATGVLVGIQFTSTAGWVLGDTIQIDTVLVEATETPGTWFDPYDILWIDTTGNANTPKRWSGTAWAAVTDKVATDAAAAALTAQTTANSKADASALASLDSKVTGQGTTIASQGTSLTSLANKVNHTTSGLDAKASSVALSALDSKVTAQDNTITSYGSAITNLQNDLDLVEGDVATKASAAAVNTLANRVTAAEGSISSTSGALTTLTNRITSAEGVNSGQTTAIDGLQTSLSTLDGALNSQATQLTSLDSRLNTRPNLLPNGGFELGIAGWSGVGWSVWNSPYWGMVATLSGVTGTAALISEPFPAAAGVPYTITGDSVMLSATGGSVYFDIQFCDQSGNTLADGDGPQNPISEVHDFSEGDDSRSKHAVSALAPAGTVSMRARFVAQNVTGGATVGCRMVKVERGSLPATAYSTEASMAAEATAARLLESRVTGAEDNVSSTSSALTSLANRVTGAEGVNSAHAGAISGLLTTAASINGTLTSQATQLTGLEASLQQGLSAADAAVAEERTARVQADNAQASARQQLEAVVATRGNFAPDVQAWPRTAQWAYLTDGWGPRLQSSAVPASGSVDSPVFDVTPGVVYTVSGDSLFMESSPGSLRGSVGFNLAFFGAANNLISFGALKMSGANHDYSDAIGDIQRHAVENLAPANAVKALVRFVWSGASGYLAIGCRRVKVERGPLPATQYTMEAEAVTVRASVQQEAIVRADQTGTLFARYSVKIDLNGYMTGYGLLAESNNGVNTSTFAVRADRFVIGSTTTNGINPFYVDGGITYMNTAVIKDASIHIAKIANLQVDDAKIISVSAAKLSVGDGTVGGNLKSANFVTGSAGWRLMPNGTAEFSGVTVRGNIFATGGQIGAFTLGSNALYAGSLGNNYAWPASGTGVHVSANGILLGNFNTGRYFEVSRDGFIGMPGLQVLNGNATFSGALSGATGTFTGALSGASGTFAGTLSGASGTFAGALSAATGTFSGALTAAAVNAVNTVNIAGEAVTVPVAVVGTSATINLSTAASVSVLILCPQASGTNPTLLVRKNGVAYRNFNANPATAAGNGTVAFIDGPISGAVTYSVETSWDSGGNVFIQLLGIKR